MKYLVFNTREEVYKANGRMIYSAKKNKEKINGKKSSEHSGWDFGKELKDGRWACEIPKKYKEDFGGIEEDLKDEDFVEVV